MKTILVLGGGTFNHVRAHFSLATPAFGATAREMAALLDAGAAALDVTTLVRTELVLTKMAAPQSPLVTNADIEAYLDAALADPATAAIVFNVALCDFDALAAGQPSGKTAPRLQSRDGELTLTLTPAKKLLPLVKARRPDIFLMGFKTTSDEDPASQCAKARRQIAETGADLVLANDLATRCNRLVTAGTVLEGDRSVLLQQAVEAILNAAIHEG